MFWERLLGRRAFRELPTADRRRPGIRDLGISLPNSLLGERMRRER